MWPWEHFAIGYIVASLLLRSLDRPLTSEVFLVLVVATQFPDLVDKPLAWAFHILPSGTTLAHSIFVAVPLSVAVIAVCYYYQIGTLGVVFAIGYLLHLPGDILYTTVTTGQQPTFDAILWPLVSSPSNGMEAGFLRKIYSLIERYEQFLTSSEIMNYVLFELGLLSTTVLLWRFDGYPGLSILERMRHTT